MMEIDWQETRAAIWRPKRQSLRAVKELDPIALTDLIGIEEQKRSLCENTERFLAGLPANNALLWGSRGTGKSSLIKAILGAYAPKGLRLIEVDKEDLADLPEILDFIRELPRRFIVFCDDLSFEQGERTYKHLKSLLEGSIEIPPKNVLIYATSNRRHLLPEYHEDNRDVQIRGGEIHYGDAVEEKISLSDRFGLWLSFYPQNLEAYLRVVDSLFPEAADRARLHEAARHFALGRGSHSGRTARQFYLHYQGRV